ncbi:hypothetical protein [Nostoc sp. UHCC 0251]|uniref:hypothetical protein n=1 Tax=Nostoc sp. UHCC 0251 TaxID=3110240 RepID=UPI002B1F2B63|nr:hypothetical protein [Nostoc sp. UHCC 0251]MEA5627336.1 hypothetical protein [Nostoc sp. UHCC 0251]
MLKLLAGLHIGTINLSFAQLGIADIFGVSELCFQTHFRAMVYPPAVGDRNIYVIVDADIGKIECSATNFLTNFSSETSLILNSDYTDISATSTRN